MNVTITSVGGRAPPGRKTRTPSGESHWRTSVRYSRVPGASGADARRSSTPVAGPRHARLVEPTVAGSRRCIPASRQPIGPPPTARDALRRDHAPFGLLAPAALGSTLVVVPWGPSSLGIGPPTNPVQFIVGRAKQRPVSRSVCLRWGLSV